MALQPLFIRDWKQLSAYGRTESDRETDRRDKKK